MLRKLLNVLAALSLLGVMLVCASGSADAQNNKIVIGTPGIPPIFSTVVVFLADKEGFFKKYGANVEVRPFDNGTAAARAVVAGDIGMSMSPTPPVINQISNAGVPLVAVYGLPNPDWILATTETGKTCKDIVGQPVGVDSIGGARSVALRSMLVGCPGVKLEQTNQVALGSSSGAAMVAGRLSYAVLHLDDLAVIEAQGKKVHVLLAMKDTNPTSHYLLYVVRADRLKANRDAYVRTVAGLIAAGRFMQDPKNADKVAAVAKITGHDAAISKAALKQFLDIGFWATKDDGMPRGKLEAVAKLMKKIGAIKADKEPVTFEKLVDASVWKDANAMVK
jgi:ABC-type nitrate/sulfonate/bicarbonate transport system substrate-binding protein